MAESNRFRLPDIPGQSGVRIPLARRSAQFSALPITQRRTHMREIRERGRKARDFRYHAPKTQARQDHHLQMFRAFIIHKYEKDEATMSPVELDELCFPANFERLYEDLCDFMIWVYDQTGPRSTATGTTISYSTLSFYRDSMAFWTKYNYRSRTVAAPPSQDVRSAMTEAMRFVVAENPDRFKKAGKRGQQVFIGLSELRQLFDYEMEHNISILNSEQHQVIWVLARLTACRPGSLVVSGKYGRSKPLTWRDLEFTRQGEEGRFDVRVRFSNIQIKDANDPERARATHQDVSLLVVLQCPEAHNIVFSAAHRLLVIALRRGLLAKGISTLDDLFGNKDRVVSIKEAHLDDPVFYASAPRGTSLDTSRPLSTVACADYLRARGHKIGFPANLQMYGIRRRAATDLIPRIGAAGVRRLLGHDPETYTLERYYMFMGEIFDATAAGLGQEYGTDDAGYSKALIAQFSPLSLNRLDATQLELTRGATLHALTTKLILADPNPPTTDDAAELRRYRKRKRYYAQQALLAEQAEVAKSTLTQERFEQRLMESESSAFAKAVVDRALGLSQSNALLAVLDAAEDNVEEDDDVEYGDASTQLQPDLEDIAQDEVNTSGTSTILISAERETEAEAQGVLGDIAYHLLARSFMETLLENSLFKPGDSDWEHHEKTCALCQDDETMTEVDRVKKYNSRFHLEGHMTAKHTAIAKWNRALEIRRATREDKMYSCLYCEEAELDIIRKYPDAANLRRHIRSSNEHNFGQVHDELKAEDGWYTADFIEPKATSNTMAKSQQVGAKKLKQAGFKVVPHRPVVGTMPVPGWPGLVYGAMDTSKSPERFAKDLLHIDPVNYSPPVVLPGFKRGYPATEIPAHMKDTLIVTKRPRLPGPMPPPSL